MSSCDDTSTPSVGEDGRTAEDELQKIILDLYVVSGGRDYTHEVEKLLWEPISCDVVGSFESAVRGECSTEGFEAPGVPDADLFRGERMPEPTPAQRGLLDRYQDRVRRRRGVGRRTNRFQNE